MVDNKKQTYSNIPYGKNLGITCPLCGYNGKPGKEKKGNIIIEIFLWCLFLLPGLIYTLWRRINKTCVCPSCGNKNLSELNGDEDIIKNLFSISRKQNLFFWLIVLILLVSLRFMGRGNNSTNNILKSSNYINSIPKYVSVEDDPEGYIRQSVENNVKQINRNYSEILNVPEFIGAECVGDCAEGHVKMSYTTKPAEEYLDPKQAGQQSASSIYWGFYWQIYWSNHKDILDNKWVTVDVIINNELKYVCKAGNHNVVSECE